MFAAGTASNMRRLLDSAHGTLQPAARQSYVLLSIRDLHTFIVRHCIIGKVCTRLPAPSQFVMAYFASSYQTRPYLHGGSPMPTKSLQLRDYVWGR